MLAVFPPPVASGHLASQGEKVPTKEKEHKGMRTQAPNSRWGSSQLQDPEGRLANWCTAGSQVFAE